MIKTVTIVAVSRKEVETKFGKKWKVGVRTDKHGDKWLSCFENEFNKKILDTFQNGLSITLKVTENGEWLNFSVANRTDLLEEEVEKLKKFVNYKEVVEPEADTSGADAVPWDEPAF